MLDATRAHDSPSQYAKMVQVDESVAKIVTCKNTI